MRIGIRIGIDKNMTGKGIKNDDNNNNNNNRNNSIGSIKSNDIKNHSSDSGNRTIKLTNISNNHVNDL